MLRACQHATLSAVARAKNQPEIACREYGDCFRINLEVYKRTKVVTSQLVAAYSEMGRVLIMTGDLDHADELIKESVRLRRQMPNFSKLQLFSPIMFTSYIQVLKCQYAEAEAQLLEALGDREMEYQMQDDIKSKRYEDHITDCSELLR